MGLSALWCAPGRVDATGADPLNRQETTMTDPTKVEREALLELLMDLGGPLCWTGPIPYNALAARHATAVRQGRQAGTDAVAIPLQGRPAGSTIAA
jgi:hypothetical protein